MLVRSLLALALAAAPLAAQFTFEKVEVRTGYGEAREGDKGRLLFSPGKIGFVSETGVEMFAIPAKSATQLFYSSVEGRRSGTPLTMPFDLLGGKRHFLTVSFETEGLQGAVELKLHKSNYENILRNAELVTGLTVQRDEPAPAVSEAAPAAPAEPPAPGLLEIVSTPAGAEVEINSAFNGLTPRRKSVKAGEYHIVIKKDGYETFEKTVLVDPGQTLEVHGELRAISAALRD
ncbi:MAG: PEGA domain-containing protein [Bryobacterales bacterium]|nr:PEGA domain-containing protein [Bryobacterales bacterium]